MMRLISSIARPTLSVLVVAVLLIGVGVCYWFSLLASLNGLEASIRERDVIRLEKYIDWPRVREQIRSDVRVSVMTQVFKEAKTDKEGGFASSVGALLAGAVAPAVIDRIVDGFVTPQSLVRLLEEKPSSQRPELNLAREGFTDLDEYTLRLGASGPIRPGIRAFLRRDGITWRVVRIVFSPGQSPWETVEPRLQLGKLVPTRTAGSLVIEGDVTNSGNVASDVPPLRVALRDSAEKEIQFRIIDPPKARLSPSETARFKTTFDHPDAAATGVAVTFSPETGVTLPDPNPPPSNAKPDTSAAAAPMVKQESEPSPMPPPRQEVVQPTQAYIPPIPAQPLTPQAPPASSAPPQTAAAATPIHAPVPSPDASAGYRALLSAWLESHKRYPESARERGEEGHAVLRFQVDRSGRVLDYTVTSSSGYADLDQAVEEMMRGATLPPFPAGMPQPRIVRN